MKVTPSDVIDPNVGADISHDDDASLTVTITNESGASVTIEVPPGTVVRWKPPAGWESATFNAPGHEEVSRLIE